MPAIQSLVAVLVSAILCIAAAHADDGGLWQTFTYDKPSAEPIVFGGESRCEGVTGGEYCIYLDIWYDDGVPEWGLKAAWPQDTHGWERTEGIFVPSRPVRKIEMYAFLRRGKGKAEFKNLKLERRGHVFGEQVPPEAVLSSKDVVVWTADSMRRITPQTFPVSAERTTTPDVRVSLARRERESFQVQVSTGADEMDGWRGDASGS